ncbi:MAG: sulfite exporter TauE/SafE family protein, partial [Clostridia bacterium]|nr:sulfite exporter TauE/SafE family protein [Clostridia bacterium]
AAAVSVCVSVPLNLNMTITYLKEIHWKKVLVPILPYMAICSAAISFSLGVDQVLIKRVFGVFLILLAAYYLFFNRGVKKRLGPWQAAAYILISALCDAFFGIGGPLMVIYFLNKTDSAKEYLGTAAAFFLINGVYNTVYRLISGILAPALLPYIGVGAAAILAGVTLAHLVAKKLNDRLIKKAVYIMIGLTGIFNLFA